MLVRARVKKIEDLPEWAKCCEKAIEYMQNLGQELVIDLSQHWDYPAGRRCRFCKSSKSVAIRGFLITSLPTRGCAALETMDLDEGPLEAA